MSKDVEGLQEKIWVLRRVLVKLVAAQVRDLGAIYAQSLIDELNGVKDE